jgi:hypothetical protein
MFHKIIPPVITCLALSFGSIAVAAGKHGHNRDKPLRGGIVA